MKNRAKCRLCQSIIESFHSTDYVLCKCGEIAVDRGDALRCYAKDFTNFLRIDDDGNEIIVKMKEDVKPLDIGNKMTRTDLLSMLDEMIKSYERLPQNALYEPVTHSDLVSALLLLSSILRA